MDRIQYFCFTLWHLIDVGNGIEMCDYQVPKQETFLQQYVLSHLPFTRFTIKIPQYVMQKFVGEIKSNPAQIHRWL